ncbi:hypothetical protein BCR35DRAFT_309518 [Leucosporidium creatinivorum]|uniref:Mediator of RNA polymerase II transcription subunit 12 n=1 Tax=Leucosporidium creatinivorum TaxID=106004 RepID=A0A1Y2DFE2_9BASI|nr:hypothetical protein BCR35DRAFT_309518 [Leucosporidium creatinivorum]
MSRTSSKRPLPTSANSGSSSAPSTTSHTFHPSPLDSLLSQNGLTRYHLQPPSWRAPWLPSKDKAGAAAGAEGGGLQAWPQFYPTCDGQEEDQLTEQAVKAGFSGRTVVQTETFSAHQLIYEKLKSNDILGNLARLASAVKKQQESNVPSYEPPNFRLPKRNTLSDSRRESWLADLANPAIPLSKLYSVIPNSARGVGLLELMWSRKVEVERAVWFVRASGAGEIQALARTRSPHLSTVITTFTTEWTSHVQEFVRKQLVEIAADVPSTNANSAGGARAGAPGAARIGTATMLGGVEGGKKAVLVDEELRKSWSIKFSWTLQLLSSLYDESLLSHSSFLRFLITQIESSTPSQLPFVLFLVEEYLAEFLQSEPMAARMVSACLGRVGELSPLPAPTAYQSSLHRTLTSLIRSTFLALPDAFVASPLWTSTTSPSQHVELEQLLMGVEEPKLRETVRVDWEELRGRQEAAGRGAAGEGEEGEAEGDEAEELETIQILDALTFPTSLSTSHKSLFRPPPPTRRRRLPLPSLLPLLFTWCTTPDRSGHHRRFAVSGLIKLELEEMRARGEEGVRGGEVERGFVEWVDALVLETPEEEKEEGEEDEEEEGGVEAEKERGNKREERVESVRRLLEELCRSGVVAFSLYLQRMIARGETEERGEGVTPSIHLTLLKTVPLYEDAGNPLAKRRVALRSSPSSRAETERLVQAAKNELFKLVPGIADEGWRAPIADSTPPAEQDCAPLLTSLSHLARDGTHLIIQRHVIPSGLARLFRPPGEHLALGVEESAVLVQTFLVTGDFWGLLQYLLLLLHHSPSRTLLIQILDVLQGDLDTWTSMGQLSVLASALFDAHKVLKTSGVGERRLIALLRQLGVAGHLDGEKVTLLEQDYQELVLSLSTSRPQAHGLPPGLPELQSLLVDSSPSAIAQLGTTLWYRYHSYDNWGIIAFDSAVQLLSAVSPNTIAVFLREINERLPTGLESQIGKWVKGLQVGVLVGTFGSKLGERLASLLGELVTEGVLSASGAVTGVLLPAWKSLLVEATSTTAAADTSESTDTPMFDPTLLQALETIASVFGSLLGDPTTHSSSSTTTLTPTLLITHQRSSSRRMSLYTHSSLADIGRCLALLVIQLELWTTSGHLERAHKTSALIQQVNACPSFQMAVARDPQTLATAMLDSEFVTSIPAITVYRPKLLAALLLTLKDGNTATPANLVSTEDWDLFLSGLTMWRLAVSKVEVQACLERLDLDNSLQDTEKAEALHTLSRHFLDRVCSGEGHTYLGEQVVKCYHGPASDELVSVAFTRLAEAVDGLAPTASPERRTHSLTTLRCTGRVLNTLLQSATAASRAEPLNLLLTAIKGCLDVLVEAEAEPAREAVLHAAHLLGIALRCSSKPASAETAELFKGCLILCAKLAASLAKDRWQESDLSSVLLDTCSHLLFGLTDMAPTARLPSLQTLLSSDLEIDALPDSTLSRLTRLFGPSSSLLPTLANPWELIEHADGGAPGAAAAAGAASTIAPSTIRSNIGPIDLALFDARVVQIIPKFTALDAQSTASSSTNGQTGPASSTAGTGISERGRQGNFDFETPCVGLSVAARDHRRTLTSARNHNLARYDPQAKTRKASAPAAAPSSTTELIIEDEPAPTMTKSGVKRKEHPEVVVIDSDDDDAPLATKPAAKKGKTSGKTTKGAARKKPKN